MEKGRDLGYCPSRPTATQIWSAGRKRSETHWLD